MGPTCYFSISVTNHMKTEKKGVMFYYRLMKIRL